MVLKREAQTRTRTRTHRIAGLSLVSLRHGEPGGDCLDPVVQGGDPCLLCVDVVLLRVDPSAQVIGFQRGEGNAGKGLLVGGNEKKNGPSDMSNTIEGGIDLLVVLISHSKNRFFLCIRLSPNNIFIYSNNNFFSTE